MKHLKALFKWFGAQVLEARRLRRMSISEVSLGINGNRVTVFAKVDGKTVELFDVKAEGSTYYANTRGAVFSKRYHPELTE
jgi:hypothetical protein